jgi:ADP-heptose:LPS heptosyltransferase
MRLRPVSDFRRPAVFFVNRFGDQLIALPLMRALGTIFPSGIQLLLGEGMLTFFYHGLPIQDVARVRWADAENYRIDLDRTARSARDCDLFLCLSYLSSVGELAQKLGATWTVGYSDHFNGHLQDDKTVHMFDKLFAFAQYLEPSLELDQFCAPPVFSPAAEAAATRYVSRFRQDGEKLVMVHPETTPEKTWPLERFAWTLDRFLSQRPEYKAIVFSLAPIDFGIHPDRVMYCDEHLELSLALMRRADLFFGVDSCFLHAADLYRIPGVALFGPTKPTHWGFRLSKSFRHLAAESMDQIQPESVLDGLLELARQATWLT